MKNIGYWKNSLILIVVIYTGISFSTGYYRDHANVISSDVVEYYSYLPAFFVHKDLKMKFLESEPENFKNKIRGNKLPNGNTVIKMSMGMSVLYAPFYLIGHVYTMFSSYPSDGFSLPFSTAITFGSLFYFFMGLAITGKILSFYFKDEIVALVLLLLSFSTNISYYLVREPAMSHTYSYFLFSLFIYFTILWYRRQSLSRSASLGLLLGLIALVRPTNILIGIVFVFWDIQSIADIRVRFRLFLSQYFNLLFIGVCCISVWIPQMFYWYEVTGNILFYSYIDERFFFTNPKIIEVLFGFRKGWFIYTPLMLIAIISFLLLYKQSKGLFWPSFMFIILNIYVVSSWWCWWYGGSYGHRAFIESYVVMAFPIAALLKWMFECGTRAKVTVCLVSLLFVFHNALQIVKLKTGAMSFESMTREAYFEVIDKLHPTPRYYSLLQKPDFERARAGLPERTDRQ